MAGCLRSGRSGDPRTSLGPRRRMSLFQLDETRLAPQRDGSRRDPSRSAARPNDPACREARRARSEATSPPIRGDAVDHLDHPVPAVTEANDTDEVARLLDCDDQSRTVVAIPARPPRDPVIDDPTTPLPLMASSAWKPGTVQATLFCAVSVDAISVAKLGGRNTQRDNPVRQRTSRGRKPPRSHGPIIAPRSAARCDEG